MNAKQSELFPTKSARNPKWNRDELILALDLYFTLDGHGEYKTNPKVIEVSELLNSLSASENKSQTFRNPSGVALKLANFMSIDESRPGGMPSVSKLDREVFNEFKGDRILLRTLSNNIKASIINKFDPLSVEDVDEEAVAKEGKRIQKLHFVKERNRFIVEKKKKSVLKQSGKLDCECCGFNFLKTYGDLAGDFIECHHIVPLSKMSIESKTELKDLALLCSNCHRMIHKLDNCSLEKLKAIYNDQKKSI